jgi:hypothetical protein
MRTIGNLALQFLSAAGDERKAESVPESDETKTTNSTACHRAGADGAEQLPRRRSPCLAPEHEAPIVATSHSRPSRGEADQGLHQRRHPFDLALQRRKGERHGGPTSMPRG